MKYNKLFEMNNKLVHYNSNNNSNMNITVLEYHQMQPFTNVENVFENNYDSSHRAQDTNNDVNTSSPL